jgi:hypothetical protein
VIFRPHVKPRERTIRGNIHISRDQKTVFLRAIRFVYILGGAILKSLGGLGRNGDHRKISVADARPIYRAADCLAILSFIYRRAIKELNFAADDGHAFRRDRIKSVKGNSLIADARPNGEFRGGAAVGRRVPI